MTHPPIADMIFWIKSGRCLKHIYQAVKEHGEGVARDNRQFINAVFWII